MRPQQQQQPQHRITNFIHKNTQLKTNTEWGERRGGEIERSARGQQAMSKFVDCELYWVVFGAMGGRDGKGGGLTDWPIV